MFQSIKKIIATNILLFLWLTAFGQEGFVTAFKGHRYTVSSVCFSPDGTKLLTASWDYTLKLWDIASGSELRTFTGHTFAVFSACFSPDGKMIASGAKDNLVNLWDTETGKLLHTFNGHTSWVREVKFSKDGKYLASVAYDKTVRIWDVQTRKLVKVLDDAIAPLICVAFSSNNKYVAAGGEDFAIHVWELKSGKQTQVLKDHREAVWSVCFSPDDSELLTAAQDKTIKQWNFSSGQLIRTIEQPSGWVNSAEYSPDGEFILSGSYEMFSLWRANSGTLVRSFAQAGGAIFKATFSTDGRYVATTNMQSANLWDICSMIGPVITWQYPVPHFITNTNEIAIKANILSDTTIRNIQIFLNDSLYLEEQHVNLPANADSVGNYERTLFLQPGINRIKIVAGSMAAYSTAENRVFYPFYKSWKNDSIKKICLIIGNATYQNSDSLPQVHNDTKNIMKSFLNAGFSCLFFLDRSFSDMNIIFEDWLKTSEPYTIAAVYYTGLVNVQSSQYSFLPVDYQTINADKPLFLQNWLKKPASSQSKILILNGFQPDDAPIPCGVALPYHSETLLVFPDLPSNNLKLSNVSLFAQCLAEVLTTNNHSFSKVIQDVRKQVEEKMFRKEGRAQIPYEISTITKEILMNVE